MHHQTHETNKRTTGITTSGDWSAKRKCKTNKNARTINNTKMKRNTRISDLGKRLHYSGTFWHRCTILFWYRCSVIATPMKPSFGIKLAESKRGRGICGGIAFCRGSPSDLHKNTKLCIETCRVNREHSECLRERA